MDFQRAESKEWEKEKALERSPNGEFSSLVFDSVSVLPNLPRDDSHEATVGALLSINIIKRCPYIFFPIFYSYASTL